MRIYVGDLFMWECAYLPPSLVMVELIHSPQLYLYLISAYSNQPNKVRSLFLPAALPSNDLAHTIDLLIT